MGVRLQLNIAKSLTSALAKLKAAQGEEKKDTEKGGDGKSTGMPCKNNGCLIKVGEEGEHQPCHYHPGNPVKLRLHLVFGENIFDETLILSQVVDLSQSSVTLSGSKAEVKLRKSDAGLGWSSFEKKDGPTTEFIQCG